MALLYIDGFDHYSNTTGAGNRLYELDPATWNHAGSASNVFSDTDTMPELGGRGLRARSYRPSGGAAPGWLTSSLPYQTQDGDTIGLGFHMFIPSMPTDPQNVTVTYPIWLNSRGVHNVDENRLGLRLSPGGALELRRDFFNGFTGLGTLLATSSSFLADNVLYHIEWATHFDAADGWSEVRINGQTALRYDGPLSQSHTAIGYSGFFYTGNTSAGAQFTGPTIHYDNLYIWDGTGDVNNDFLGERNVATVFVDSDESPQDWTLSDGSDAFDLLDGVPPDPENDFIESATASEISKFGTADLPSMDISVVGVQTTVQAYKTGTSDTDIDIGLDIASDLDVGGSPLIQDQPTYFTHITEVHPDTGDPLTPAEVQSALIHIERTL